MLLGSAGTRGLLWSRRSRFCGNSSEQSKVCSHGTGILAQERWINKYVISQVISPPRKTKVKKNRVVSILHLCGSWEPPHFTVRSERESALAPLCLPGRSCSPVLIPQVTQYLSSHALDSPEPGVSPTQFSDVNRWAVTTPATGSSWLNLRGSHLQLVGGPELHHRSAARLDGSACR